MEEQFTAEWLEQHRVAPEQLRAAEVLGIGHVLREIESLIGRLRPGRRGGRRGGAAARHLVLGPGWRREDTDGTLAGGPARRRRADVRGG